VAYAERRGSGPAPWRVRYKLPDGASGSEPGFRTQAAAVSWGRGQEAAARTGRAGAARAGRAGAAAVPVTVGDWIDRWLALQDVGVSTLDRYGYLIRRFLRPAFGGTRLSVLGSEQVTRWELALPASAGVSRRTAADARALLRTILGDAAAAWPPLIGHNPAVRPRNRGRRTGRRMERSPRRAWATPLQVLLVAERAALLTGRDEDFTLIVTMAWTGMRWGEAIGLETGLVRPGHLCVEWQLREVAGVFHRLPPKDDSYRSTLWEPCLPVDLPPFLGALLTRQARDRPDQCACVAGHGGSGQYVFLGPGGGHYRRSNYARRVFRPACDGRRDAGPGRPGRVIITDATAWPGVPVAAWPPAAPGQVIELPGRRADRPHRDFLEWHLEKVFKAS
jgi:integrase